MGANLTAAENLAQAIRQVAKKAHTEEDLRVGVEQALSMTLQENPIHTHLAALLQQVHQLAAGGEAGLVAVEAEVDEAAAELWGITDEELKEIRRSLEELG
jgi:thiaminase